MESLSTHYHANRITVWKVYLRTFVFEDLISNIACRSPRISSGEASCFLICFRAYKIPVSFFRTKFKKKSESKRHGYSYTKINVRKCSKAKLCLENEIV